MTIFISLLRGINVRGQRRVPMQELARMYESLGFTGVRTYLQSGNVLFDSQGTEPGQLSALIGERIAQVFGFQVKIILWDSDDFRRIIRSNPFLRDNVDAGTLHVTFLSDISPETITEFLRSGENGVDRYILAGKEVFLSCPDEYGKTKFSNAFFEKMLDTVGTTRNWKTVTTLAEMADTALL
jgi:uncharacterized protein (DUF1697 family)